MNLGEMPVKNKEQLIWEESDHIMFINSCRNKLLKIVMQNVTRNRITHYRYIGVKST